MRRWAALVLLVAALAGCSTAAPQATEEIDGPFADCAAVVAADVVSGLPDLTVPCFNGGMSVRLSQVKGPAVVNLWASWCGPCRAELPAFAGLAAKAEGRFTVLGVVTGDSRKAAADLAADLGVTFPTVFDDRARLSTELVKAERASTGLPLTLFVKDGRIVHVYQGAALDQAGLDKLVGEHLGLRL
ncbi:MAG: TlpA family protein disulfide reductase [Hamadaea sp.]|nr:TlpA family protein disulfide reductase [Hamadaea sp.]